MTNAPVQDSRRSRNYPRAAAAAIYARLRRSVLISDRNLATGVTDAASAAAAVFTGCDGELLGNITTVSVGEPLIVRTAAAHIVHSARSVCPNPDGHGNIASGRIIGHA